MKYIKDFDTYINENYIAGGVGSIDTSVITNNPVFKVSIVPASDELQEKPRYKIDRKKLKLGDIIEGNRLTKKGEKDNKKYIGRIQRIERDEKGNDLYYIIIDEKGKRIKINPNAASFIDFSDEDPNIIKNAMHYQLQKKNPIYKSI